MDLAGEVTRLKNLYPRTQLRYIKACIESEYLSRFLQVIQDEAMRMRMNSFVPDYNVLKSHFEQNSYNSSSLSKQVKDVMDSRINDLLNELAFLEIESPILIADYKVKLQYQQKFTDRLELVCQNPYSVSNVCYC